MIYSERSRRKIASPEVIEVDMVKVMGRVGIGSRGKCKRLIAQGAVRVDDVVVGRYAHIVDGCILRVGKRFIRRLCNTDTIDVEVREVSDGVEIEVL